MKERDKLLLDYTGKNKDLTVSLHLEQESVSKLKAQCDQLDREAKGLRDELLSLRSM